MGNNQNDVKVSIVMPVYNTAPYLRQCIDSVLAQTLKEFELICVDDGSTDGSVEILGEYATRDNRIQILKQQNQYAGVARNNGFKIARGEYVIFLDSDDVFSDVLLEHTYNAGVEKNADIVLLDFLRFDNNTKEPVKYPASHLIKQDKEVFSRDDIPDTIFSVATRNTFTGLYRREFINENNIRFQEISNSNDVYFSLYARALAKRITIVDEQLVYYRRGREGSLQATKKDAEPLCFLQAFLALYNDLIKDNLYEELKTSFQHDINDDIIYHLNSAKATETRIAILKALDEEPYCNLPVNERPKGSDEDKAVKRYKKVKAAREWYHKNLRINQLGEELKNNKTAPPIEEQGTVTVSVVIPVYNTEEYLREALDSIVNQTLRDIEIICVNDGSTDDSAEILDEYAKKDSRISIITQENKGLSCARNAGIMKARGKYIYFMDSDDILETTALEELIPVMEEKDLDVMFFDGESFAEDPELITAYYQTAYRRSRAYNDVYEGAELLKLFRSEHKYNPVVWLQVYKTSFLRENDIYFIPGILHEDNAFTYSTFLNAKRVSHTNKAYFHRRLRGNSIKTKAADFANVYGYYKCFWNMLETYAKFSSNFTDEISRHALNSTIPVLNNAQYQYEALESSGSELGMIDDLSIFKKLVCEGAKLNEYKERLNNCREKRDTLKEKLNNQKEKNTALKEKLENNKQKSSTFKEKLDKQKAKDKKLNEKLESSKQKNEKLQAKLDAYKQENQTLKKKLKNEKKKNRRIQNSTSYKIGRMITYIPRKIKKLFKK